MKKPKRQKLGDKDAGLVVRSTKFKVVVSGDREQYLKVINSIRDFRAILRQLCSVASYCKSSSAKLVVNDNGFLQVAFDRDASASLMRELSNLGLERGTACSNGKPYYELRPYFFKIVKGLADSRRAAGQAGSDFDSSCWDEASKFVKVISDAPDPKSGIPRSCLFSKGDREVPEIRNFGIPIKYYQSSGGRARIEERQDGSLVIVLKWADDIGEVEFVLDGHYMLNGNLAKIKANPGARFVFHKMATGEWPFQCPIINERDGKLSLTISYKKPQWSRATCDGCGAEMAHKLMVPIPVEMKVKMPDGRMPIGKCPECAGSCFALEPKYDMEQTAELWFSKVKGSELPRRKDEESRRRDIDKTFFLHIKLVGRSGKNRRIKRIAVNDAISIVNRISIQMRDKEIRRDCCRKSSPKNVQKSIASEINALARRRANFSTSKNHYWSQEVVKTVSMYWNCGKLVVYGPPSGAVSQSNPIENDGLCGLPWNWSQFKTFLDYKAKQFGLQVEYKPHQPIRLEQVLEDDEMPSTTEVDGIVHV